MRVIFESLLGHLVSLWAGTPGVTFESLLGHFNSFCVSVELGGRPLHNYKGRFEFCWNKSVFMFDATVLSGEVVVGAFTSQGHGADAFTRDCHADRTPATASSAHEVDGNTRELVEAW